MQLIAPDVLLAARGLSVGASVGLVAVGGLLWLAGWRYHRFWVVFGITLAAGIAGLSASREAAGQQTMVVGVLVAVSAGMLALELAKLLAFATAGVAAWVLAQSVVPQAQELWAVFLSGGLFGVVLYRVWTMLVTSFLGVLISWHAALTLASTSSAFDGVTWATANSVALNGAAVAVTVFGVVVQSRTAAQPVAEPDQVGETDAPATLVAAAPPPPRRSWGWARAA